MKEHQIACQKGAQQKSALAEHAWENHHPIKWEGVTEIDCARTTKQLLLKEAIHICCIAQVSTGMKALSC